jgi:hypothetical protein
MWSWASAPMTLRIAVLVASWTMWSVQACGLVMGRTKPEQEWATTCLGPPWSLTMTGNPDDDLAERVGDGGENEEVAAGVDAGEFLAVAEAEEAGAGAFEGLFHLGAVGAVADDDELGGDVARAESGVGLFPDSGEEREVLLDADAPIGEDADGGVGVVAR